MSKTSIKRDTKTVYECQEHSVSHHAAHMCTCTLELLVFRMFQAEDRIECCVDIAQKYAAKDNIIDFIDVINLIYFYEKELPNNNNPQTIFIYKQ